MDIDLIRAICMALPFATESIKWENNLVFSIGGKMFAITSLEGPVHLSLKTDEATREAWQDRQGVAPAPYLARAGWISVQPSAQCTRKELEQLVAGSYRLVMATLTKKQQAALQPGPQNLFHTLILNSGFAAPLRGHEPTNDRVQIGIALYFLYPADRCYRPGVNYSGHSQTH